MSIYNKGSSGTQALKEFLELFDHKVDTISSPIIIKKKDFYKSTSRIKSFDKDVILIIEPGRFFQQPDIDSIELAAKTGCRVMIFSENEYKLIPFLRTKKKIKKEAGKKKKEKDRKFESFIPGYNNFGYTNKYFLTAPKTTSRIKYDRFTLFGGVKKIELTGKKRFKKWNRGWRIMLKDRYGTIALYKKIGKGKIMLFSDSQFLSNYYIRKEDNCVFIYRLIKYFLKDKTVYFNEYYHGYERRYTKLYFLAEKKSFNIVIQIIVFFLFLFIASGIKFGQFKKETGILQERIYYFSEGMRNLIAKRKFNKDIFNMMLANFKKFSNLKPGTAIKQKLIKIKELQETQKKGKVRKSEIMKLYSIINNKE